MLTIFVTSNCPGNTTNNYIGKGAIHICGFFCMSSGLFSMMCLNDGKVDPSHRQKP